MVSQFHKSSLKREVPLFQIGVAGGWSAVVSESEENKERVNGSQIGLKDVLAVVDMATGEQSGAPDFSSLNDIFLKKCEFSLASYRPPKIYVSC